MKVTVTLDIWRIGQSILAVLAYLIVASVVRASYALDTPSVLYGGVSLFVWAFGAYAIWGRQEGSTS